MDLFLGIMELVIRLLKTDIQLYGYTFSFWNVIILILVFGIVCFLIGGIIGGK